MAGTVDLKVEEGIAILRLQRGSGNAINGELVDDLVAAIAEAARREEVLGVLLASTGKLFSPGLDLPELIGCDRPTMEDFLERFSEMVLALYDFPKPMVAALHGHAVAGGCVLALTADWRVLSREALIGLNEVKVGVPFPYGVAMILRESVPTQHLEEIALFGRNYRGEEALAAGLVHEVHDAEGFEEHCLERLSELTDKDPQATSITKRYLRAATVERIRTNQATLARDFLECWFSDGTRTRIQAIVDSLKR